MVEYGLSDAQGGINMLRIAVCDDDLQELTRISNLLNQYHAEKEPAFQYDTFTNALDLLDGMKGYSYQVLFLDVLMPGFNGMEAAREIRRFDGEVKIIFLTSSREFAVESYGVDAFYYMLKPGTEQKLFPLLDKIFLDAQRGEEALPIKTSSGFTRIPYGKMEYVEVFNKKVRFHLSDGTTKEVNGSLADFEGPLLSREAFIKVHRSYIVNMASVLSLNQKELTTGTGKAVPISRLLTAAVREAYMQYLFVEKGVK